MQNAAQKDVPCAYCDTSVVSSAFVLCEACEVPVHADCWKEGGKCPTYACGCTRTIDPALALFRGAGSRAVTAGVAADAAPARVAPAAVSATPPVSAALAGDADDLGRMIVEGAQEFAGTLKAVARGAAQAAGLELWKPATPPAPARPGERAELDASLRGLRNRRWIRRVGAVTAILMFPLVAKLIARQVVFPYVALVFAWLSWPGWDVKDHRKREKAIRGRIAQIEQLETHG